MNHSHTQTQLELSDRERKKRVSFKYVDKYTIQGNKHMTSVIQKKINKKAIYLARYSKYD
jgi:hypothetical protein